MHHVATQREQRVVGVDFLNKCLGNDPRGIPPGSPIHPNWKVGETVLIGANSAFANPNNPSPDFFNFTPPSNLKEARPIPDLLGNNIADNWREASFLREWVCGGVVLSNDEPYAHTSNGNRDVQVFNICVQGRAVCNNGYGTYVSN